MWLGKLSVRTIAVYGWAKQQQEQQHTHKKKRTSHSTKNIGNIKQSISFFYLYHWHYGSNGIITIYSSVRA